jgi:hypothetical protein
MYTKGQKDIFFFFRNKPNLPFCCLPENVQCVSCDQLSSKKSDFNIVHITYQLSWNLYKPMQAIEPAWNSLFFYEDCNMWHLDSLIMLLNRNPPDGTCNFVR